MNKQFVKMGLNITLILCFTITCIVAIPKLQKPLARGIFELNNISEDEYFLKSNISSYMIQERDNNTTVPVERPKAVMKAIGAKDSNDFSKITDTPADVKKLMKQEEKNIGKRKKIGKTSEEAYLGGGNLIKYNGVEIQSKIPSAFYSPDIKKLLKEGADLTIRDKSKPTVLVYHSHTTEAYSLLDKGYYISSDARSEDSSRNTVRVGEELVKYLEKQGFKVIHDKKIHDRDYNASYDNSRQSVERYLEEYPSIDITIDLHRDDITYKNKTKVKPTVKVNGKKAAKMMIISGCEYGLVKSFPDWEYNLRFDLAVQQKLSSMYQGLMRPILFSQRRYNMFETHNSFLLEIGTDANTLDEACYSARLFGDALGKLLNERYVKEQ
ncbi:MAG: stage II sporulation protein P [Eubacterium sp.]|nr:stage II sporulation protein P [Eubacterium sp.]